MLLSSSTVPSFNTMSTAVVPSFCNVTTTVRLSWVFKILIDCDLPYAKLNLLRSARDIVGIFLPVSVFPSVKNRYTFSLRSPGLNFINLRVLFVVNILNTLSNGSISMDGCVTVMVILVAPSFL